MRVRQLEGEVGMPCARLLDHARGNVDAESFGGLERGQKLALAAADLDHLHPRRDQEFVDFDQTALVVAAEPLPAFRAIGVIVPELRALAGVFGLELIHSGGAGELAPHIETA